MSGMSMGDLSNIVGIGAGLSSMFGSGSQNPYSAPGFYQPTGQGSADTNFQQMLNQNMGANQQIDPALLQAFQQQMGINTQPMIQAGGQAGQMYAGLSGQQQQAGQNMMGMGNQVMQTAFDPQQNLFNQQQQLVQDQSRAASAASGLSMSPYAAGQEQNAMSNFDINWQNQQLGRQTQGMNAAEGAYTQGLQSMGQAPQSMMQSGSVPIQAQQQAYQMPAQAAYQYGQGMQGMDQNMMNQILAYLGHGTSAAGTQAGAYDWSQQNSQQQGGAGLSSLMSGLSGLGSSSGGGSSMFSGLGDWLGGLFGGAGILDAAGTGASGVGASDAAVSMATFA